MTTVYIALAYSYCPARRDWVDPVRYSARTLVEARHWHKFNRDHMRIGKVFTVELDNHNYLAHMIDYAERRSR